MPFVPVGRKDTLHTDRTTWWQITGTVPIRSNSQTLVVLRWTLRTGLLASLLVTRTLRTGLLAILLGAFGRYERSKDANLSRLVS